MSGAPEGAYNLAYDLLDRHLVAGRGDQVALVFEDSAGFVASYTYRQLLTAACRFGHALAQVGVVPGDRVFFRVPNHPSFYAGALACARIGAVFVPSSTAFRAEEVSFRLRDSGAVVAVTTAELRREIDAAASSCPELREVLVADYDGEPPAAGADALSRRMAKGRDHLAVAPTRAEDPLLLAYTSGTTGPPKGVLHLQRYARSYDSLVRDWHRYAPGDVAACPAEIGWMLPVASTFLYAFRAGITVFLQRERGGAFRPAAFLERLAKHRVTNLVGTPTVWRLLLEEEAPRARFDLSRLARGTSAGEPLPPDTLARARERFGVDVLDGLGMSECMVYAHAREGEVVPGSCGRAADGVRLEVLDADLRPLPAGEEGVLCVRRDSHPGMMREYWGRPDATAEAFRGEWYWSGDVVTRDEQGFLRFVGREDDVMKCSGYRISPFEVESALCSHPAVLEAAAIARPDRLRGAVVHAVVVLRPDAAVAGDVAARRVEDALIAHVRERLAPFKAPRSVEFVPALPKTQSGKVRRGELREQRRQEPSD